VRHLGGVELGTDVDDVGWERELAQVERAAGEYEHAIGFEDLRRDRVHCRQAEPGAGPDDGGEPRAPFRTRGIGRPSASRPRGPADPVPDSGWEQAARHHDEQELAALVLSIVATINGWNRLNVRDAAGGRPGVVSATIR
jgi:hypothetical protein